MNKSQNKIKKINNEETELVKLNDLFFKKNNVNIKWKLSSFWPCLVFVIVPLICEIIFAILIKFTNNKIFFFVYLYSFNEYPIFVCFSRFCYMYL